MRSDPHTEVTTLLGAVREGEPAAEDRLFDIVYDELKMVARGAIEPGRQLDGRTLLQPTALVHEVWLKLTGKLDDVESRRHFFALAAKAMRQVISDHAKAARRQKRGGDARTMLLHDQAVAGDGGGGGGMVDLIDLHDALSRLASLNDRHARVTELRLLGAMTLDEIATTLGVSKRTAESDWSMARAWLSNELR